MDCVDQGQGQTLIGHLACATTFMHHIHLGYLLQLQAVHRQSQGLAGRVLAAAARLSPSHRNELLEQGMSELLVSSPARAAWRATNPNRSPVAGSR